MGFNAKVRCIKCSDKRFFATGNMYEIKNGVLTGENNHMFAVESMKDVNSFFDNKFELVEEKQFTKADLRTGMRVKLRNGNKCTVLFNTANGDIITGEFWCPLSRYNEDLMRNASGFNDYADIMEVYQPKSNKAYGNRNFEDMKLIWQRPEPRQITKSEAEKLLSEQLEEQVKIID